MNERERLYKLVEDIDEIACHITCDQDCYAYITDRLLKKGVIFPPCKVGDTVWCIVDGIKVPLEARVRSLLIAEKTIDFCLVIKGYYTATANSDDFGESVFLTKEEAEAALAERNKQ